MDNPVQTLARNPKILRNLDVISLENYLREAGNQMPSGQEGVVVLFPQRKVLMTH
jgi:hypothetical protein